MMVKTAHYAHTLLLSCRDDDVVGRWGGEEFVCLINAQNDDQAMQVADRMRTSIARIILAPITTTLTVSIGLCRISRTTLFAQALHQADEALYQAKQTGRNKVVSVENPHVS